VTNEPADPEGSSESGAVPEIEANARLAENEQLRIEIERYGAISQKLLEEEANLQARIGGLQRLADDKARSALEIEAAKRERELRLSGITGSPLPRKSWGPLVIQDALDGAEIARSADPDAAVDVAVDVAVHATVDAAVHAAAEAADAAVKVAIDEEHDKQAQRARDGKAARRATDPGAVSPDEIRAAWDGANRATPGRLKKVVDAEVMAGLGLSKRQVERARLRK
jgi:hypothetical protein